MSTLLGISDENVILIIMSWLDLRDYGLLDLSLTNTVERKLWMICLSSAQLKFTLRTIYCTHSLLRWLIKRKMQPEVITCCGYFSVIDDRSFVGIDNKLLHTIDLSGNKVTDAGILMIAQGCPQLTDISLRHCKKISDEGLLALAVNLPGMTSIDLCLTSDMTCAGVSAIAERCPALVKISLSAYCLSTSDLVALNDLIFAIARGCPKLQTFSILFSNEITDHSVAFLAGRCKKLRSLTVYECERVTDEAMKAVANRCPHLEKLRIGGRSFTSEYGESFTSKITDESFLVVGHKCSKLMDISIAYNEVTDIGIAALARGCRRLRSFSANKCPSISTDGMMALSRGCRMLRTIYLADCRRISDGCLFRISEGCTRLISFTLSSNDLVTNVGISHIARGCAKLTSITIEDCSQIDDTALIAIGSSCPNLLGITVKATCDHYGKFSDRGLIAIACGCPALESITISNCPNITDVGVKIVAQNCFQLKSITFSSSKITDASLIAFATNSRKLQSVTFDHCHCITSIGLSILAAECTLMQSIWFKTSKKVKKENLLSLRRKYLLANSLQNGATEHNHLTSLLSNSIQNGTTEHNHRTSVLSMLRHFISCK